MINFSNNDNDKEHFFLGLKDYPTRNVSCKNCNINLVDFQITKSNEDLVEENVKPINTRALIICNTCDYREKVEIRGQFYIGAGQENLTIDIIECGTLKEDEKKSDIIVLAKLKQ